MDESTYTWVMENRMEFSRCGAPNLGLAGMNVHSSSTKTGDECTFVNNSGGLGF